MENSSVQVCVYYQAKSPKEKHWILTAWLRSFEHLAFDRTCDVQDGVFEFFVPECLERYFVEIMDEFCKHGIIYDLQKLPNRLI
jgi:hypothetical protein